MNVTEKGRITPGARDLFEGIWATARKLQISREMSDTQIAADLALIQSKMREALLKERLRKELVRLDDLTNKPRCVCMYDRVGVYIYIYIYIYGSLDENVLRTHYCFLSKFTDQDVCA